MDDNANINLRFLLPIKLINPIFLIYNKELIN